DCLHLGHRLAGMDLGEKRSEPHRKIVGVLGSGLIGAEANMTQVQRAATNMDAVSGGNGAGDAVPLWRLHVLRGRYALMAAADGSIQLQAFLHHAHWTPTSGAQLPSGARAPVDCRNP